MDERLKMMIVRRYKSLLPSGGLSQTSREILSTATSKYRLVLSNNDVMRSSFFFMLLQQHTLTDIDLFSLYDFIDIYLEKSTRYQRLLDITPPVLLVYAGFEEFTNKRLEEAFIQVAENQRVHRNQLWFFYRGSQSQMKARYPTIQTYMERCKYQVLDLSKGSPQSPKEVAEF